MAVRIFGVLLPGRTREKPVAEKRQFWNVPNGYGMGYTVGGPTGELEQALCNAASYACIDVLVDHISAAPWDVVRYVDGGRQPVEPLPLLIRDPSPVVNEDIWRSQLAFALVTDGNAFGQILSYIGNGLPRQVEWVDPASVVEREVVRGIPTVKIGPQREVHRLYPHGDILHVPGRMIRPGSPFAESPVEYANRTIGTSLSAQSFTSEWFQGGGHPSIGIQVEGLDSTEQALQIKNNYQSMVRTGEAWVFSDAIKTTEFQAKPDTTVLDIVAQAGIAACQVWHVPPTWIYIAVSGQNVTYANVAQADVAGLKDSVDPYWRRCEAVFTRCLPDPQKMRVNRDATLRTDAATRIDVQAKRLANHLMSVNEGRKQEDERPWDDPKYDEPGLPLIAGTEAAPIKAPSIPTTLPTAPH